MKYLMTTLAAAALLAGCAQAEQAADNAASKIESTAKDGMAKVKAEVAEMTPGADLAALPSGTYKAEQGHTYVTFQYWHQDYARMTVRFNTTDATINFDSENPENSTLTVTIPSASIDTGVAKWDEHIKSADFFDVETYPDITFVSTDVDQAFMGGGSVTGTLTIKGVSKPVTLKGKVNKVGKHFRSGVDMFGVSAKTSLKRSEFGVDKYAPMADDIDISIEAEFQKVEE